MKTSEILTQAKALIVDPANWQKGMFRIVKERDAAGNEVHVCYCGLGAVREVVEENGDLYTGCSHPAALALRDTAIVARFLEDGGWSSKTSPLDKASFAVFNDYCTHEDVIHAFDAAIADQQALGN